MCVPQVGGIDRLGAVADDDAAGQGVAQGRDHANLMLHRGADFGPGGGHGGAGAGGGTRVMARGQQPGQRLQGLPGIGM